MLLSEALVEDSLSVLNVTSYVPTWIVTQTKCPTWPSKNTKLTVANNRTREVQCGVNQRTPEYSVLSNEFLFSFMGYDTPMQ
jgi:hypothetical protein